MTPIRYPPVRISDHVDDRFGVDIHDPYRRLEDLDSPETAAWVAAQNELTEQKLGAIEARESIRARLEQLLDYEKPSLPVLRGGRVFTTWNDGLRPQPMLCLMDGPDPVVLVDPNEPSGDGTVALAAFTPSPDGNRVAYGLAVAGSDWTEWRIVDVATRITLDDRLERIRFSSPAWTRDGKGLFHAAFDADDVVRLRLHRLGEDQSEDTLIYERPEFPWWRFQPVVTDDGRWLVIYLFDQTGGPNGIVLVDVRTGERHELPDAFAGRFSFCDNDGSTFWFVTDLGAPRARLVSYDLKAPGWREIVPEHADTLQWALLKGDRFIAGYLSHAQSVVRRFLLDGTPDGEVPLPGAGWAGGFSGPREAPESLFLFMSFTQPPALCRYVVERNSVELLRKPAPAFDPDGIVTTQHFFAGKDGTRVPMFVTHSRDLTPDGARPVLIWGYGGFGIPIVPWFWPLAIAWIERGGVFAVPAIRGGGEYGEEWHRAGSGPNKQNSFDDFIAAAEWLIAEGFTKPGKIALSGASNGGLLVGACITQRPDLFGAAHIDMGLLDMLHIDRVRVGLAMAAEYGSMEDPEDVRRLHSYSPLHNVRAGTRYPATLLTTGNHDELVLPYNSYKFAAAMQSAQGGDAPVLLRVEFDAGHGVGKPTAKVLAEQTDILTFLLAAVGEA